MAMSNGSENEANTQMRSVRISKDLDSKLADAAAQNGLSVSDFHRQLLQNGLETPELMAERDLDPSGNARARLRTNLEELQRLHSHKESLDRQVEEKGGKPGWIFSGAPKHLLEAQVAAETALNQLALVIQANRREIEAIMRGDN